MAKSSTPPPAPRPMVPLRDWLAQHPEYASESAAGFVQHAAADPWDTAEGWARRWTAWLHQRI